MSIDTRIAEIAAGAAALSLLFSVWSLRIAHKAEVTSRKPVLVFVYMTAGGGWVLQNIGNAPALDVVVYQCDPGGKFEKGKKAPPLGAGGELPLANEVQGRRDLAARYAAHDGSPFYTVCRNFHSVTGKGNGGLPTSADSIDPDKFIAGARPKA